MDSIPRMDFGNRLGVYCSIPVENCFYLWNFITSLFNHHRKAHISHIYITELIPVLPYLVTVCVVFFMKLCGYFYNMCSPVIPP
jgi:hypothetical protein